MTRVGVVGATGAVGSVTLGLLAERGFENVRAFATSRSAGKEVPYGDGELAVEEATAERLRAGDLDLFDALADASVSVDTIIQTGDDIVFSAPIEDRTATEAALGGLDANWEERADLGKVSVIGAGMKSHPGIAARTFQTLRDLGVEPDLVATSPIKIAFYIPQGDVERAVVALHEAFELSSVEAERAHD